MDKLSACPRPCEDRGVKEAPGESQRFRRDVGKGMKTGMDRERMDVSDREQCGNAWKGFAVR